MALSVWVEAVISEGEVGRESLLKWFMSVARVNKHLTL